MKLEINLLRHQLETLKKLADHKGQGIKRYAAELLEVAMIEQQRKIKWPTVCIICGAEKKLVKNEHHCFECN
jgi:hypothetical protein